MLISIIAFSQRSGDWIIKWMLTITLWLLLLLNGNYLHTNMIMLHINTIPSPQKLNTNRKAVHQFIYWLVTFSFLLLCDCCEIIKLADLNKNNNFDP